MNANFSYTLVLILFISLLAGCTTSAIPSTSSPSPISDLPSLTTASQTNLVDGCVDNYKADVDYFPNKVLLTQATGFKVEYFKNYKVVKVLTPYRDSQETFQYILVQCGTPTPTGFDNAEIVEVPVNSIVSMANRYLPMLKALGIYNKLVGVDMISAIYDPIVLQMAKDGKIAELGYGAEVNIEQVVNLNPDLIMTYAGRQAQYNAHPKLLEAGLKVAINGEYMESTPLGRAEWLKFIALFFNREETATQYFDAIVSRYSEIANRAQGASDKPSVFWGVPGKDTWYMPGGGSFIAKLLSDAGANYLWADDTSTGNMPLAFEVVFERASKSDIWLAADGYPSLAEMLAADNRLSSFAAIENSRIWSNDARINDVGGNDYWESGLANPDVVLADLIKIMHPELLPEHELVYWRRFK